MFDTTSYLSTPYVKGGRGLTDGCDCWGLVKMIYAREYGIVLPEYYETFIHVSEAKSALVSQGEWIPRKSYVSPSISFMKLYGADIDHVVFNVDAYRFIHITKEKGLPFLTKRSDPIYRTRIVKGFYEYNS